MAWGGQDYSVQLAFKPKLNQSYLAESEDDVICSRCSHELSRSPTPEANAYSTPLRFEEFDRNGDGVIDRDEWQAMRGRSRVEEALWALRSRSPSPAVQLMR